MENIIEVKSLAKIFGNQTALEDVSFQVKKGETFGFLGPSGCGKSTTGRTILRLLEPTSGNVIFDGENIAALNSKEMRSKRRDMQIVFQDPFASLNPRMKVYNIIEEPLINFGVKDSTERMKRVYEVAEHVGLS